MRQSLWQPNQEVAQSKLEDSNGAIIDGAFMNIQVASPLVAEAASLRAAIHMAGKYSNSQSVFVCFDATQVADAIASDDCCSWEIRTIILDIRFLLASLSNVVIKCVPRTADTVADFVAKNACHDNWPVDWIINPPQRLQSLCISDLQYQ